MVAAVSLAILQIWKCSWNRKYWTNTGVFLETEGSIWKIQNRAFFHYKKVKKGTSNNLTSHYVHSLFTIVSIKQFFLENKSLRVGSWNLSQFFWKGPGNVVLFYEMFVFYYQLLIPNLKTFTLYSADWI